MSHRAVRAAAAALASLLFATAASAGDFHLNNRTFHLPDGFTIELAAAPPLADRPIICDFDEQGRLYVADSSGSSAKVQQQLEQRPHRIVRLEDTDGDGVFDKQTIFADHMMFPEGALWHAGSLYVAAPPSIWKLTDTDGDGVADQRVEWFQGKTLTGCANDLHGPYNGPDGMIYWTKGAFAKQTYTLPNGKPFTTRAAHIFRATPDGQNIEPVMTGGMDNPVEVAFTPAGERIFTTTFLQSPADGKRDGLIHAIYGGVYGKVHDVIDDHVRTGPDLMPVLAHLGPAAACALTRYESQVFGKAYQDNLFSTSFNLRKVFRHVLTPAGATFKATIEDFLTSDDLDFHPTHLVEDADGSLLVVDTGGWYKLCCPTSQLQKPDILGAIYRIRRTNTPKIEDPRGLKLSWSTMSPTDLANLLADPRPAVQKRAIATLATRASASTPSPKAATDTPSPHAPSAVGEGRGEGRATETVAILSTLDKLLQSSNNPRARLNAVWAACRIPGPDARTTVRVALADKDETVVHAATHAVGLWRDPLAVPDLLALLEHPSLHVRRAAAEAIGRCGRADTAPALLAAIQKTADGRYFDQVLQHSLTYALIELDPPESIHDQLLKVAFDSTKHPVTRSAALVTLDQLNSRLLGDLAKGWGKDMANLIFSKDAGLRDTTVWVTTRHPVLGDMLAGEFKALLTGQRPPANADQVRAQLAALSKSPAIQKLVSGMAADPKARDDVRQLMLGVMTDAPQTELPAPWMATLTTMLTDDSGRLATMAATAIRRHAPRRPSPELTTALLAFAARRGVSTDARLDALTTLPPNTAKEAADLPPLSAELFAYVSGYLTPDNLPRLRLSAAEVLGRARLTRDQLLSLTDAVASAAPLEVDQLLGAFGQSSADDAVAEKLLDALEHARAGASLRADTIRTRTKKFGPDVQRRVAALCAKLNPDADAQRARIEQVLATLNTGDVRRGQAVFNSAKSACVSCHQIGYVGGHVGPDLSRVGAIRQERDLVESILFPSASFVQSYEPIVVETTDGDVQSGIMRRNDAEEVLLVAGPDRDLHIPRSDVKTIRPGTLSVMPTGLDQQLTPQDLADLVTFLKNCK